MEKKKPWLITAAIVASAQLLVQVLTVIFVLRLNMLPNQYVIVFMLVMLLLLEGVALFMFIPVKNRIRLWRKIVSCILSAVIMAGCVFASSVAWNTYNFVDEVTSGGTFNAGNSIRVWVLQESPAQTVADTNGFRYGLITTNYEVEYTQQMIETVESETANNVSFTYFEDTTVMVDALYNGEIDALIMHDTSVSDLIERDGYKDFIERARDLYSLTIEDKKMEMPDKPPQENLEQSCFIVYISGSDTRSKYLNVSRSDVNILAVVNPNTKQILLLNTPRDFYVSNPAGNGELDKLTHCGIYGVGCSVQTLSSLYGAEIDYYTQINFTGFEKLVDAIGGITIYSDVSFRTNEGSYIQKGENKLDGKTALQYARERQHVSGGDDTRGKNQMKVIKAIFEKMTSSTTLITNYAEILKSLEKMFVTNFHAEEISDLVKMQLDDNATWNIQSFAVYGTGGYGECYSSPGLELYITRPNEDSVDHAKSLIGRVFAGDVLTADDMVVPKK